MFDGLRPDAKTPREGRFSLLPANALVGGMLLLLSWLTTEHFLPWVSWHSEAIGFLAVVLVAWMGLFRLPGNRRTRPIEVPLLALPFALMGVIAFAQIAGGLMTFAGDVAVLWFYLALCIVCLIIGFNLEPSAEDDSSDPAARWSPLTLLAFVFAMGSVASVVIAFAQVFDLWEDSAWIVRLFDMRRPGGNLAQPNQLGTLVIMGLASVAYLHASGRSTVLVSALVVTVLGAGLAATESRAGVLALVVLLAWWQLKRSSVAPGVSPWAGPAVTVLFLALFFGWPHFLNALQLAGNAQNRLGNGDVRLAMWAQLMEAVMQRPWAGWGILEVAKAHNAVAHDYPVNNPFSYSHNLLLDLAVWMGLPAALGLSVAAAVWLWRRLKWVGGLVPWYCLAIALPLATHSMLEFPFAYAYFLAPVVFLLGVLERRWGAIPMIRMGARCAAVALALVSAGLLWSVVEYLPIEEDFRVVRFEQLRIGHTPAEHHQPQVVLLTQLGALLTGSRIELQRSMPPEDLEALKKLALRYPWVATQYRYALALALNGQQQEAVRQLQVLRWTRDEKVYARIKGALAELAETKYPELRTLKLP